MAKNNNNNFFEDFTKLAGSAMDTAMHSMADFKAQFDAMVSSRLDSILNEKNLVSREEFEVVKKMAEKARSEQEKLEKKVKELEKKAK